MEKDHGTIKYIVKQTALYNDKRLTDVLVNAFNLMYYNREPDGCLSTSTALHVILQSFGYAPKLCYGLCLCPNGHEIYHAWLELDEKIIDTSIYGNSRFSPLWMGYPLSAVILEPYSSTELQYRDHTFDKDWKNSLISMIVKMGSIKNYIINAPSVPPTGNGMWNLIFAFLNEKYSKERQIFLEKYISTERLAGPDN